MKTGIWSTRLLRGSLLAALAGLVVISTPAISNAEIIDSGGTYAWNTPVTFDLTKKAGAILPVSGDVKALEKGVGATVLCTVYDRGGGAPADPWGAGIGHPEQMFVRGVDPTMRGSPELDRSARYLYVYQI